MPPWILTTPSSRGIGLALTRRLVRSTNLPLVATARTELDRTRDAILNPEVLEGEEDMQGLMEIGGDGEGRLTVLRVDVTDETTIKNAAAQCKDLFPPSTSTKTKDSKEQGPNHLHLALLTPGILHPEKSPSQLNAADLLDTFRVNTIGPLLLMKHFSPFLPRKSASTPLLLPPSSSDDQNTNHTLNPSTAIFAALSARVGSISDNALGGWYSYRSSKAALNQSIKTFDNHLKVSSGERAMAVGLHPGTVKTGLSREFWGNVKGEKLFSPGFAAGKLISVLGGLKVGGGRGRCWDWQGTEVPP